MGDPQSCQRVLRPSAEGLHCLQHRSLAVWVKERCGLIEEKQSRITCQGSSDGQALFLPPAEGMDGTLPKSVESELLKQAFHPSAALLGSELPRHPEHQVAACCWQQQLMVWVLKNKSSAMGRFNESDLRLQQAGN